MIRLVKWAAYTGVLATVLYLAALAGVPYGVMSLIKSRMAQLGTSVNVMAHSERSSHTSRTVVRPSPELLYSICWYDLSKGPVRVVSGAPQGTYWSVALYRNNTDNFFVINDQKTQGAKASLLIHTAEQIAGDKAAFDAKYAQPGDIGVTSPSPTGLILIRTLINDEKTLPVIDAERRQATCGLAAP
jgi:uncharacterized membrane protein